ncbi:MAG TPA: GNAT family N-acetyltransferase [Candidatus Deferrimicrobium sp.]|nr:GNAT family N-acetyltransferase [Candidatus Deferrimicrobium sp.]
MPEQQASRIAGPDDVDSVGRTIALAFAEDPVWGPAMGGTRTTIDEKARIWRIFVAGAVRYPWSRTVDGAAAVSIWLPPGSSELDESQEEGLTMVLVELLGPTGAAEYAELMGRFDANHPQQAPHAYLSLLATRPDQRGRGIGMALLANDLDRLDQLHVSAYLESTNPANDRRYQGVGFEPVGQFRTVDEQRLITTMWRPAR